MKLLSDAHSTEPDEALGAWVLRESKEKEPVDGLGSRGQNSQSGGSQAGAGRSVVSRLGRSLTPNVRMRALGPL